MSMEGWEREKSGVVGDMNGRVGCTVIPFLREGYVPRPLADKQKFANECGAP